jgi:hypothetical protein
MITQRAWHGTCKTWNRFNLRACNPESACGRGFYFSDCINDATTYSVKSHPDHIAKISRKKYDLIDRGMTYHTAEKKAKRLYNAPSRLIECELLMRNPLRLWKEGSKVYVRRQSFKRLSKVLEGYRDDGQESNSGENLINALADEVNTSELYRLMLRCGLSVFPRLVRALGYDSCIMYNTMEWWPYWYKNQANHYIVYSRKQIVKIAENVVDAA